MKKISIRTLEEFKNLFVDYKIYFNKDILIVKAPLIFAEHIETKEIDLVYTYYSEEENDNKLGFSCCLIDSDVRYSKFSFNSYYSECEASTIENVKDYLFIKKGYREIDNNSELYLQIIELIKNEKDRS